MEPSIWNRNSLCWLDDKRVVVVSNNDVSETYQCELLDTVSSYKKVIVDAGNFFRTFGRLFFQENNERTNITTEQSSCVTSIAKM